MRPSLSAALAASLSLAHHAWASPVAITRRQAVTTSASTSAAAGVSLSTSASVTSASVTLYSAADRGFAAAPTSDVVSAPSSGCVLATQQLSTFTEVFTSGMDHGRSGFLETLLIVLSWKVTTDVVTFSAGLYCTCAGDLIAGIVTSFDPSGTAYLYCATGTAASTTAVGTLAPQASADPGNPDNPDVSSIHALDMLSGDELTRCYVVGGCLLRLWLAAEYRRQKPSTSLVE